MFPEKYSHRDIELFTKRMNRAIRGLAQACLSLPVFQTQRTNRGTLPAEWVARNTFDFAGRRVPKWLAEFDMIFSGGKGTGKTTIFKKVMFSLILSEILDQMLRQRTEFIDWRSMNWNLWAYTPKNDDFYWPLRSLLDPFGIPVRSTNPFRKGSWAWHPFEKDIVGLASLEHTVSAFVKEKPNENNRYFTDAARIVLRAVILSLVMTHRPLITFRIVVKICESLYLLRQVLKRTPHTACALTLLDEKTQGQTAGSVFTTLLNEVKKLEAIAAELDEIPPERRFSAKEIASTPGVWVSESEPRYPEAMELYNGLVDDFVTEHLLVRGNIGFTTYRFIDELPQLNGRSKSPNCQRLSEWGRQSRVRNVQAVQNNVQLEETWGDKAADAFLGQAHNAVVLRHSDIGGREYWSKRIGNIRGFEEKHSYQSQSGWSRDAYGNWTLSGSDTHGVSIERFDRAKAPSDVIGNLPIATLLYGIHGFALMPISPDLNPETGAPDSLTFLFHLSGEWMLGVDPPKHPEFKPYNDVMTEPKLVLRSLDDDELLLLELDRDPNEPRAK